MPQITIKRDDTKPFSVFEVVRSMVKAIKDTAGQKTDIILDGFDTSQAGAVQNLIALPFVFAAGAKPRFADMKVELLGASASPRRTVKIDLGKFGVLSSERDDTLRRTHISFPHPIEQEFPVHAADHILTSTYKSLIESTPLGVTLDGKRYRAYSFPTLDYLALSEMLISNLSAAHGGTADDIKTVKEGLVIGGQKHVAVLLAEPMYQRLVANEKAHQPSPPPLP